MQNVVFDIETNGLLPELDRIHCLVLRDRHNPQAIISCTDSAPGYRSIAEGLEILANAERVYAHNGVGFDIPAIQKIYPEWKLKGKLMDTLVIARHRFAHQRDLDWDLFNRDKIPGEIIRKHSLEAWGFRLGVRKDEYAGGWDVWNPEMQSYCEQDTGVLLALVEHIARAGVSAEAVETEMELAQYLFYQEQNGWPFNEEKAQKLYAKLAGERERLRSVLQKLFPGWYVKKPDFIPKRNNKTKGYIAGVPVPRQEWVEFKPGSREHILKVLNERYGWFPTEKTETGAPKVDDDALQGVTGEGIEQIREYLLVSKRISQLAEGKQGWLKTVVNGKIHGRVDQSGTITHRAAHFNPNLGQVPKAKIDKVTGKLLYGMDGGLECAYGTECRELFGVLPGWQLMGADASGLELRCLAHYMAKYDGGAYGRIILEGDIHTTNQNAIIEYAGEGKPGREKTKTFFYGWVYGSGDAKSGKILKPELPEPQRTEVGKKAKAMFISKIPALKYLVESVKKTAKAKKYLKVLDGRRVYVRKEHAALNTLLQSAGAIICKRWIVEFSRRMTAEFGPQGWDGKWAALGWIHDEIQVAVKPEIAKKACKIAIESIQHMTEHFQFRCPLTGEARLGSHWAETH